MEYFPAFLNRHARACLLVGAGEVASRKARLSLSAGARLTVVAPQCDASLLDKAANGELRLVQREFRPSDVRGQWLVVGATNDREVQALVKDAADAEGIFCNCVDDAAGSSYINPAVVHRSPIVVAISSGGAAPVLARKIRAELEVMLPASLGKLAKIARHLRALVSESIGNTFARRRFWERVFDGGIARAIHFRSWR